MLKEAWNQCHKKSSEDLLIWWDRYDGILAELKLLETVKSDQEKKTQAMYLCGEEFATIAELLGGPYHFTYMQFQNAMLKRDRDFRVYGVARDQQLADATLLRNQVPQYQLSLRCYKWCFRSNTQTILERIRISQ